MVMIANLCRPFQGTLEEGAQRDQDADHNCKRIGRCFGERCTSLYLHNDIQALSKDTDSTQERLEVQEHGPIVTSRN